MTTDARRSAGGMGWVEREDRLYKQQKQARKIADLLRKKGYCFSSWHVGFTAVFYVKHLGDGPITPQNAPLALLHHTLTETVEVYMHDGTLEYPHNQNFKPIPRHPPVTIDCNGLGHVAICNRVEKAWLELVNIERISGIESLAEQD